MPKKERKFGAGWAGRQFSSERAKRSVRQLIVTDVVVRKQFALGRNSDRCVQGGQGFVDFSIAQSGRYAGKVRRRISTTHRMLRVI